MHGNLHCLAIDFLDNKTIVITGPKLRNSNDLIEKVKYILKQCPAWLVPGIVVDSKSTLRLSNGAALLSRSYEASNFRGLNIDFLFVDETCGIPSQKVNELIQTVVPAMVPHNGGIAITATPGDHTEAFNTIWKSSQEKDSIFAGFSATWRDHPDRDDSWKQSIVNRMGQATFDKEYECIL